MNMKYLEFFESILDNNETVIETFKPSHKRFVGLTVLRNFLTSLVALVFPGIFVLIIALGDESSETGTIDYVIPGVIAALILFGFIFSAIARVVVYKKTYYCCTNKRIIIRRGFIGADYQTLDYDMIGGMDVEVNFFDKIIKPNTGTISFITAASPLLPKTGTSYFFAHIEDPYETYKRIKGYTSKNKDGKFNS